MAEGEFSLEAVRLFMIENGGRVTNHQLVTRFKNFLSDPQRKGEYREKFKDFVNLLASIKEEEGEKYLVLKKRYRELGCANLFANRDNFSSIEDGSSPLVDHGATPGSVAAAAAAHDAVAKQLAATGSGSSSIAPSAGSRATDASEPTAVATPLAQPTEKVVIRASSGAPSANAAPLSSLGDSKAATANQDFGFYSSGAAGSSRPQVTIVARTPAVPTEGAAAVPSSRTEQQQPARGRDGNGSLATAAATSSSSTTSTISGRSGVLQAMVLGSKGVRAPWDSRSSSSVSDKDRPVATDSVPTTTAAATVPAVPIIVEPTDVPAVAPPAVPASGSASSLQSVSPRQAAGGRSHSRISRAGSEPPTSTGPDRAAAAGSSISASGSPPLVEESTSPVIEEPKISVKERTRAINRMTSDTDISYSSGAQFKARKRESRLQNSTAHDFEDGESTGGIVQVALDPDEREWMILSSSADFHAMSRLLRKNPGLARQKDFTCGYTGLHWAAKHGKLDVVKLLMTHDADVNARSHGGFTPLHLAVIHAQYEVVELLVRVYGASFSIRDYSGKRPKQYLKRDALPAVQGLLQDSSRPTFSLTSAGSEDSGLGRTASFKSKRSSAASFSSRVSKVLSSSNENVKGGDELSPAGTPTQSPRVSRKTPSLIFGFGKDSSSQHDSNREQMPPPSVVPSSHARNKRVSKMAVTSSAAMLPSATVGSIKDYADSSAGSSSAMIRSGSAPEIAKPNDHAESRP